MLDQSVFTETIHEVAEIIRTSATPLSKEEILSYFKEMELNEQQENMVLEFLLTPHEEEEAEEETDEAEGEEQEAADWQETSDASALAQNDSGKKEEKTKNQVMASVGDNIRKMYELLSGSVDIVLEWNEGGHFNEPDIRTAKAFEHILSK